MRIFWVKTEIQLEVINLGVNCCRTINITFCDPIRVDILLLIVRITLLSVSPPCACCLFRGE